MITKKELEIKIEQEMELFLTSILLGLVFLILFFSFHLHHHHMRGSTDLPPGTRGWLFIGETLEFLSAGRKGHPERFVFDRMARFSEHCFRTNIIGERNVAVMCGAQGNKFLFSNENKLAEVWWPASVEKVFPPSDRAANAQDEARDMRKFMPMFLKPEALQRYVGVMDRIARRHFDEEWVGKDEILVFSLAKRYTFQLACKIFLSIEDPNHIARFSGPFKLIPSGIITLPVDLPGTPFNRAIKATKFIRKELKEVIKQRIVDLAANKATSTQDILSHMLTTPIDKEAGQQRFMNEDDIANKIIALLIGGDGTASAVVTFIVKYLAELPHVYDLVYKEQMEIARSKREGELLTWDDLKKMKYSWNVASEVMRLISPLQGGFREALQDFTFSGFRVPKGWKLYWSSYATHHNAKYFPDPKSFDPSRFEGNGPAPYTYVPFGGGPRMCPGKEYARLEILVFVHNVVKRFKWKKLIAEEKIIINPLSFPAKGLPIRIHPHDTK